MHQAVQRGRADQGKDINPKRKTQTQKPRQEGENLPALLPGFVVHRDTTRREDMDMTSDSNDIEEDETGSKERKPSLTLEEIMKKYPGRFTIGHEKLEKEGIKAFILPGCPPQMKLWKEKM